jgi:hypothetical protein
LLVVVVNAVDRVLLAAEGDGVVGAEDDDEESEIFSKPAVTVTGDIKF